MVTLRRKQRSDQGDWLKAIANIEQAVPRVHLAELISRTSSEILRVTKGKRVGYGWSGGKDSVVLRGLMEDLGIRRCCLGMTNLEYPAFLQWVTVNMPPELQIFNNGWDLDWLCDHPDMLFPPDATTAGKWFKGVNHFGQDQFFKARGLDMIILGRRVADGNHCGPNGVYTNRRGITRYSPLRHWTHEEALAYIKYFKCSLPPCYSWPRGYRVGTGSWPARQWTRSVQHGWSEVWRIDSSIVRAAAQRIDSAKKFMDSR